MDQREKLEDASVSSELPFHIHNWSIITVSINRWKGVWKGTPSMP